MSGVFFDEFDIPRPDHHLGVGGGSHGQNTGRMIEHIETILLKVQPACTLFYGDGQAAERIRDALLAKEEPE